MTDIDEVGFADPGVAFPGPPLRDLDAERAVLGGLIQSGQARIEVIGGRLLTATDFYAPVHEETFEALTAMDAEGKKVDPITVNAELVRRGIPQRYGDVTLVHTLIAACPTAANASFHARIVREKAVLREITKRAMQGIQLAHAAEGRDADDILAAWKADVAALDGVGRVADEPEIADVMAGILSKLYDEGPDTSFRLEWPWREFREGHDGLPFVQPARPGQLIVIGGRPSQGKSTILANLVRQWCLAEETPTVLFTKEMPPDQWLERIISAEARIPLKRLKVRDIRPDEWDRLHRAAALVDKAPLKIRQSGGTLADCRAEMRRHGARVLAYDYLQLAPLGEARTSSDRQMRLADFVQGMKDLAMDEQAIVATAAQLNRVNVTAGKPSPPTIDNFRETGAIEQAIDVGILVHRPDFYEKESDRAGEADFIVGKQRDGETGVRTVVAQLHLCRFVDMAADR